MSALRAAFDTERAWLRGCEDQRAVLDRMASYRDNLATARRNGNEDAYKLVEQLIELAEDRLTELKADVLRAKQRPPAIPSPLPQGLRPAAPPEPPAAPTAPPARSHEPDLVQRLQTQLAASVEAQRRAAQERDDAERRARAAQDREAARVSPPAQPTSDVRREITPVRPPVPRPIVGSGARLDLPPRLVPAQPSPRPPTHPTASPPRPPAPPTASSRSAQPVAEPPETGARRERMATLPAPGTSGAPPDRASTGGRAARTPPPAVPSARPAPVLTGADLAAFRRDAGLTQIAAAQRLGVTQGTISKAEGTPGAALGPALTEALRRAVD